MNRKAKIITNLSVLTLVLAGVAQFYTNRKIDQTLAQFPYHFAHEFTLHAEVKDKDFFTRDVLFSIEDSQGVKSRIINSHLIALPFAVTARSELTPEVIKNLNKNLNIAIDQNVINSKFSVVGDYLQSTMETKFRDATNTAQSLTTDLNFIAKTNFIEIDTALSGFNNNAVTKFNNVTASYQLQPLGNHRYDLVKAAIRAGSVDMKDGENRHYKIDNANYRLDKSFTDSEYNLDTALSGDRITFSYSNEQWTMDKFALSSKQQGIAQDMLFIEQMKKLDEQANVKQVLTLFLDYVLDNRQWQGGLRFDKLSWAQSEKFLVLGKTAFDFNFIQQNKQLADFDTNFNMASLAYTENKQPFGQIKNLTFSSKSAQLNVTETAALIRQYLPEQFTQGAVLKKDNANFIKDFQIFVKNHKPVTQTAFSVEQVDAAMNRILLKNLKVDWQENVKENDEFNGQFSLKADQIAHAEQNLSVNQLALSLPLKAQPYSVIQSLYFCTNDYYSLLCGANLSEQTLQKWWQTALTQSQASLEQGTLSLQLDTYPKSSGAEKIDVQISADLPQIEGKGQDVLWDKLQALNLDLSAQIPAKLFDEQTLLNKSLSNSLLWYSLSELKQAGDLPLENDQYQLKFALRQGKAFLNGKDVESLKHNETNMGDEEIVPEPQKQDNQTNETPK